MRYAARRDANTVEIESLFRAMGCVVHPTNGAWDLTVQHGGITMLVECKDGKKRPSARKLTPAQEKLHAAICVRIVTDEASVRSAVDTLKKWSLFIRKGFMDDINVSV